MSRPSIELSTFSTNITQPKLLRLGSEIDHAIPTSNGEPGLLLTIDPPAATVIPHPNNATTAIVLVMVVFVTMISSLLGGLMTVGLPTMANELGLPASVLLWPISIYALTCGCTLLLLGSVADVVGSRPMYLTGCVLQSAFTLACGLSQNGTQLIIFRGFAGIAISFCLPSAVSIITSTFPEGKRRNLAFAAMGGGQPIGFSLGLTLGGVFADTIGWRWAFHIAAIINTAVFFVGFFGLPKVDVPHDNIWYRLKTEIDWVGITMGSVCLALLSYSFASLTGSTSNILRPVTLFMLAMSILLIPAFVYWVGRQERLGRPAIIPNSLWKNRVFTCICIGVFITWGVFNTIESLQTLFYQDVQHISAIQTSLRFLPAPFAGIISNLVMGLVVHRVRADWLVEFGIAMTSLGCLLMSVINPSWSYWACAFPATFLNPIGADALFTVSNLVISKAFPAKTQALAGGVFNTIAQIGKSVGLVTSAVIASSVTEQSHFIDKTGPPALMQGFTAAFWYLFALSCVTGPIFVWGLKGIGKVGVKRD